MADINQFNRSKDRIVELIHHLMHKTNTDQDTDRHIRLLELALYTLDRKIAEYQDEVEASQGAGLLDVSF